MGVVMGVIVAVIVVMALVLSVLSRQQEAPGLVDARLAPCPETPNCVCSEYPEQQAYVAPLPVEGDAAAAWQRARSAIEQSGGKIAHEEETYIAATYTSLLFRFVDDLELRLDRDAGVIHIRSASRVGRSDLGANSKRVARLREHFTQSVSDSKQTGQPN